MKGIAYVQFFERRPHSVETLDGYGYDVAYCRRDDSLYKHYHGGGGFKECRGLHPAAYPDPPPFEVWAPEGTSFHLYGTASGDRYAGDIVPEPLDAEGLRAIGYVRLAEPYEFNIDEIPEARCLWCPECKDDLPVPGWVGDDENGRVWACGHVGECDRCGDFFGPGYDCECPPVDGGDS